MAINPNLFQFDDGRFIDLSGASGLGVKEAGVEQNRLRRAGIMQQNMAQQMDPARSSFGPLKGLHEGLGLGPNPQWDGYFGALQGKENADESQGGNFRFGRGSWGNPKTERLYKPTWDPRFQESALEGLQRGYTPPRFNRSFR
jgi:hypothetical protein